MHALGAQPVLVTGARVALVVAVCQAATQAIDFGVFNLRFPEFNADKHYSVFGLASLLAQAAVAVVAAWRARDGHRRGPWLCLAALVAGLVLVRGLASFNATVLATPLAAVFALLVWLTLRDGAVRALIWGGLTLLVLSLLLHKVGLAADSSTASDHSWGYQLTGMVKHGAELAGWIMLATGVAAGAWSGAVVGGYVIRRSRSSLKDAPRRRR